MVVFIDTSRPEMEFLDISSLGAAYRYVIKIEQKLKQKTLTIWAWEPLTEKSRKGQAPTRRKKDKKIWIASGQPVQDARKEGHQKDKERY
jgi:hypothetical protein